MKHIKKFNLIVESVKSDLKEFCEINCAYLIDDDYKIMITRRDSLPIESSHHKKGLIIHFYRWHQANRVGFNWVEIKDQFIPFIQRLSKEYTLVECQIDYGKSVLPRKFLYSKALTCTIYVVSMEDLLNSNLPKRLIERILIIVEEE
jgi:hypothetical protein